MMKCTEYTSKNLEMRGLSQSLNEATFEHGSLMLHVLDAVPHINTVSGVLTDLAAGKDEHS